MRASSGTRSRTGSVPSSTMTSSRSAYVCSKKFSIASGTNGRRSKVGITQETSTGGPHSLFEHLARSRYLLSDNSLQRASEARNSDTHIEWFRRVQGLLGPVGFAPSEPIHDNRVRNRDQGFLELLEGRSRDAGQVRGVSDSIPGSTGVDRANLGVDEVSRGVGGNGLGHVVLKSLPPASVGPSFLRD